MILLTSLLMVRITLIILPLHQGDKFLNDRLLSYTVLFVVFFIATVILSTEHALYFGDSSGTVHVVNTHSIIQGVYTSEVLPGGHHSKVDFLVVLHGKLNAHGFLSGCGVTSSINEDKRPRSASICNNRQLNSVPCTILMSIGVGYQELFKQLINDTYFVTWAVPSMHCSVEYGSV